MGHLKSAFTPYFRTLRENPTSAWPGFFDVLVNNNELKQQQIIVVMIATGENARHNVTRHNVNRRAQFVSFNFTNALICAIASSAQRGTYSAA